jgi:hypothetical protein
VVGVAGAGLLYSYWDQAVPIAALAINYMRYWSAPAGILATEVAQTGAAAPRFGGGDSTSAAALMSPACQSINRPETGTAMRARCYGERRNFLEEVACSALSY